MKLDEVVTGEEYVIFDFRTDRAHAAWELRARGRANQIVRPQGVETRLVNLTVTQASQLGHPGGSVFGWKAAETYGSYFDWENPRVGQQVTVRAFYLCGLEEAESVGRVLRARRDPPGPAPAVTDFL